MEDSTEKLKLKIIYRSAYFPQENSCMEGEVCEGAAGQVKVGLPQHSQHCLSGDTRIPLHFQLIDQLLLGIITNPRLLVMKHSTLLKEGIQ